MAIEIAKYAFLPWARRGAASSIETVDSLGANQAGFVSIPVSLSINNNPPISRKVRLYGPGEVIGIDRQQVIRIDPRPRATDFEPNYFPLIEFDRPDFPWLFTPAKAEGADRLRPWLCLVVVRKHEGVELQTDPNQPLPILIIKVPAHPEQELPDLSESWAWAHTQVTHREQITSPMEDLLAGTPALNLSRLLSPRRLDPSTEYLACLVPTFKLGLKAGLGMPIQSSDETNLMPAWDFNAEPLDEIVLPIYYHWEFRTGVGGDFEELVRLLEPGTLNENVGKRPIDISQPGFDINPPLPPATVLQLEGALRIPEKQTSNDPSKDWSETSRLPFQTALKEILNAPWEAVKDTSKQDEEPLLAPPIYGCWQAAKHIVDIPAEPPASPPLPPWLHELNLDPRHRSFAALGTQVIQAQQEQLMASAWEQLGEIERINQMRRQAQLGRAVNSVYYRKHLVPLPSETLLKVVSSAQSRIVVTAGDTSRRVLLSQRITQSAIPDRAVSAPIRRWTNPRSPISTRFQAANIRPISIVTQLNRPESAVAFQRTDAGAIRIDQVDRGIGGNLNPLIFFDHISTTLASGSPVIRLLPKPATVTRLSGAPLAHYNGAAEGDSARLLDSLINPPDFTDPLSVPDSPFAAAFRRLAQERDDYSNYKLFMTFFHKYLFVFPGGNGILYGVCPNSRNPRLLRFRHKRENGHDLITDASIIGVGVWHAHNFLFSGGNGIIYGVNQIGQLLFYRDKTLDGAGVMLSDPTGVISTPVDQAVWLNMKFVFSGGNGIIYAVNQQGQLLFYRDKTLDGKSVVTNPSVIGQGGWLAFKFLFSGGNGTIYAVDQEGKLLFYHDKTQDGTGDVANPSIISQGGWQNYKFVFAGGDGTLYAVDQEGKLLLTHDETQDGSRLLPTPVVIGEKANSSSALPMDLAETKADVLHSVNPETTITARISASLRLADDHRETEDPLEPLLDAPDFPQPMYEALRDLSQDYLLPGLEHVSPNTVTVLETNSKFIESFLVGLNHEMGHELLWRGYPTDQRGTYFRQFWDSLSDDEVASRDDPRDIDMIKDWGNKELGDNVHNSKALVLLIRGELLRRYPNTAIYAVKAVRHEDDNLLYLTEKASQAETQSHPIFRGTLKPDVTFLGFDLTLTLEDVLGEPGWFFVIQEQPTEPRFGLDVANFEEPIPDLTGTWSNLNWRHLANTPERLKALSYASVNTTLPVIDNIAWGKNAAQQAFITLQRPVRIAIHAKQMIVQQ